MTDQVRDLRKLPLEELTSQEITSRIHLIQDANCVLMKELQENQRAITALQVQYEKLKK